MNRKKTQLIVTIDEKIHQDLKIRAIRKSMTLKDWILTAVAHYVRYEEELDHNERTKIDVRHPVHPVKHN